MRKEKEGIVIDTTGNMAKVKLTRHGECNNCGMCPGENYLVLDVNNELGAKPGQHVNIEVQETNMLKAAFIVYMIPLVLTLLGYILGVRLASVFVLPVKEFGTGTALAAFVIAVFYIKVYDKATNSNRKMQPVITNIST